MKKIYFSLFLLTSVVFNVLSQEQRLVSSNPTNLIVKNTSKNYNSVKKVVGDVLYEDFKGVSKILMMQKDAPELPVYSKSVQLPNSGKVSVEITFDGFEEFDNINVLPSKGSLKRNINPNDIANQFGSAFYENDFFPGNLAEISKTFIFRNTRGATVVFYPFQYNPVTKKLRVYKNISARVITNQSETGTNEKSSSIIERNVVFPSLYRNLYLNTTDYIPVQEEGEMLIIAPDAYISSLQPFINWKSEKGIKTSIATLSQTGTTAQSIKSYIQNFYLANPNLVYIQLVGDHEQLTSYTYGLVGSEQLWSDSYYGQLEGTDLFPELLVGRMSGSISDVTTMITRTLEYETNPLAGNWMTNAIGIGSDEGDGYGDDGEADWQHLRNIGTKLTTYGYGTIHEFYDGNHGGNDMPSSPTSAMISTAINQGAGLLNYTGHGWTEGVSTGNYTSSNVNSLTNSGKYPFVISVACNNGTFVGQTSICESFTRAKYNETPAGAIASCGSSILMAWAEPMQTQDEMTELIVKSDVLNIKTTIGGLFYNGQISMLESYNQSNTSEEVMKTWVFFGDPSTVFRSQITSSIVANHVDTITTNGATLVIQSNTNGALVAITQNNDIIATSEIIGGSTSIEIPALSSTNDLKVTLTKQNTKPYRGLIEVTTLGLNQFENQFVVYPNPSSDYINIKNNGISFLDVTVKIFDLNGRSVYSENNINLNSDYRVPVSNLATGLYLLEINDGSNRKVQKIEVK